MNVANIRFTFEGRSSHLSKDCIIITEFVMNYTIHHTPFVNISSEAVNVECYRKLVLYSLPLSYTEGVLEAVDRCPLKCYND